MSAMCAHFPALVCFAVREEAAPFQRLVQGREDVRTMVTGMGAQNACGSLKRALDDQLARLVVTCGFAGGLNPTLSRGDLLYAGTPPPEAADALTRQGVRPGSFYLSDRVAVMARDKQRLWRETGADAVEMESLAMATICLKRSIPCLILRVILDEAAEDLPLDFNELVTPGWEMDQGRLARAIATAPWKIPGLIRLKRRSSVAARKLAAALTGVLGLPQHRSP